MVAGLRRNPRPAPLPPVFGVIPQESVKKVTGDHPTATSTVDPETMDVSGFCAAIERLKADAYRQIGPADFVHLRRIERYGLVATLLGYATAWIIPNPLSAFLLSLGQFTRWLLAHHILHRGYDRVPGIPPRYTSRVFARGWRRYVDWFDWLLPEAWDHEHNVLHHYHTGEDGDPDVAERHLEFLRRLRIPHPPQ